MRVETPIEDYARSIMRALEVDLPAITYQRRVRPDFYDPKTNQPPWNMWPSEDASRRPDSHDIVDVRSFYRQFGSTATMFGGIGGAAMTTALVVVVMGIKTACVYCGGNHVYTVDDYRGNQAFMADLNNLSLRDRKQAVEKYGATFPDMEKWLRAMS